MPALNFQERFAEPVKLGLIDPHATGAKTQSIRPERIRPIKIGDALYLYTGMRTKRCEKLGEAICRKTTNIIIGPVGIFTAKNKYWCLKQKHTELNPFAQQDGFSNWPEMRDWFEQRHGLPFTGVLISW